MDNGTVLQLYAFYRFMEGLARGVMEGAHYHRWH
jgi:hypothetical protein